MTSRSASVQARSMALCYVERARRIRAPKRGLALRRNGRLHTFIIGTALLVAAAAGHPRAQTQVPPPQTTPAGPVQPPALPGPGRGPGRGPVVIGPPAPVPPEVTMLRPSPEELTQVNDALRGFIRTNTSP